MAEFTENLNLEMPDKTEQYNVAVQNSNMKKIDDFSKLIPPRALTADKLTTGVNINNVFFDGTQDIEIETGGSGFNLFDTKILDHILQGEEALGWALQGTYVTKESYPDFYQRCLDEYKDENTVSYIPSEPWTQPVATADTTPIIGGDMVFTASSVSSGWKAYLAFDGIGTATAKGWATDGTNTAGWWQVKFPYKIRITGLKYYRRYSGSNDNATTGRFYTSSEKTVAIGNEFSVSAKASEQYSLDIASIPSDGIVTDTIYLETQAITGSYGGMDYLEITAVRDLLETHIYKNPNGHKFYPLEDKSQVDNFYEKYGIADFYGIDEENERVFLPRNKYFAIKKPTSDVPVIGNGLVFGLTDGTSYGSYAANANGNLTFHTDLYGKTVGSSKAGNGGSKYVGMGFTSDPEKSGLVVDSSSMLQPDESKYLYYCVGNTEVTQAITNVTEVTTSENDTIPLFTGMYFDFKPNNVSWLKAGEQQNSGGIYETCYNTLVEIVNGVNNYDLKVINEADMLADIDYSEYWVLNQDNLTFRAPTRTSERVLIEKKEPTETDPNWYNLYSDGWLEQGGTIIQSGDISVTYLKPFANTNYSIANCGSYSANVADNNIGTLTTTGFAGRYATTSLPFKWIACGYAEIPTLNNLYFKVANAVQNLELLDAGEVLEGLANVIPDNSSLIASYSKPSRKYIELELGATGTIYTAPANGFVSLCMNSKASAQYILLQAGRVQTNVFSTASSQALRTYIPVAKNQSFNVSYTTTGDLVYFTFIYDLGSESEAN